MKPSDFPTIQHVFVLMLENHSFDHLLGFSGIRGNDAESGNPTKVNGLAGDEYNSYKNIKYHVENPAGYSMPIDPGHEFEDTLFQLTGSLTTSYNPAVGYPTINNGGFVADYVNTITPDEGHAPDNFGEIMRCYSPEQLPVLNALAREFAVCDSWFSSIPGPTWPNRFFVHAATSGGLDHSPTKEDILEWENLSGLAFENGTVFDQLKESFDDGYRIYRGDKFLSDSFPNAAALKGIHAKQAIPISHFDGDISDTNYKWPYTFIEPSYGDVVNNTYKGGTSQHPLDDITNGEYLIKQTYESIRKSPLWEKSLFVVIWDEHGGFYDHTVPPKAVAPGDTTVHPSMNQHGFDFKQYGVRVPAVVVSPLIPKNIIDHRLYDHSSIPKTLHDIFDLKPLTQRDAHANSLLPLLSLQKARTDAPLTLPIPAKSNVTEIAQQGNEVSNAPLNKGNLPGFLQSALKTDLQMSPKEEHPVIKARFEDIKTQAQAKDYMETVKSKMDRQP